MMQDRLWARYGHIWNGYDGVVRHTTAAASQVRRSSRFRANTSRRFEALWEIQGRSCLVASEISCLSRGGFPYGASARARTLLELAVTADILTTCDPIVVQRYDHQVLRTARTTASTYAKHAVDLFGGQAVDDVKEAEAAVQRLTTAIDAYRQIDMAGPINGTLWWARDEILRRGHSLPPKKAITFEDLASTTALAAWLPFYRHFNRPIHAGGEGQTDLYTTGLYGRRFLVGRTDSGYVDPAQVALECLLVVLNCLTSVAQPIPDPSLEIGSLRVLRLAADEVIDALGSETHGSMESGRTHTESGLHHSLRNPQRIRPTTAPCRHLRRLLDRRSSTTTRGGSCVQFDGALPDVKPLAKDSLSVPHVKMAA